MSFTATQKSKQTRRSCELCRRRKARFQYQGAVRSARHHTLCSAGFQSISDRRGAQLMAEAPSTRSHRSPFIPELTDGQIVHRRMMLTLPSQVQGRAIELSSQGPS